MQLGTNDIDGTTVLLSQDRDGSFFAVMPDWFNPAMREPYSLRFSAGVTLAHVGSVVAAAIAAGAPYGIPPAA